MNIVNKFRELTEKPSVLSSLVPPQLKFENIKPSGYYAIFDGSIEERVNAVRSITDPSLTFSQRVNTELERISAYHQAVSLWANFGRRSQILAEHLGYDENRYKQLLAENNHISPKLFCILRDQAASQGLSVSDLSNIFVNLKPIQSKFYARQRMLMMKALMNSTPVLVEDLMQGKSSGTYGFGDPSKAQIFQGKATISDLSISATASPRLFREDGNKNSGYVFRFCVGKNQFDGFEEDHPLFMLDPKFVESFKAWHNQRFPNLEYNENPLIMSLVDLLQVSVHDWAHSWLLYDLNARTKEFSSWGNEIFSGVEHLNKNKLLINYELITASMHNYTWRIMFDSSPDLMLSIYQTLEEYCQQVSDFKHFTEQRSGRERAFKEESYMMYMVLSTLPCVLDRSSQPLQDLFNKYPLVKEQIERILGAFFDFLSSNVDGVPSSRKSGENVGTAEYVAHYPLAEEFEERIRQERISQIISSNGQVALDSYIAFADLPEHVRRMFAQSRTAEDPSIFIQLKNAIEKVSSQLKDEGLEQSFIKRLRLSEEGNLYFRLNRKEIDIESMQPCLQDKKVLLVAYEGAESFPLELGIKKSLTRNAKKQQTVLTSDDILAFNVQNERHAELIMQAAYNKTGKEKISAMIQQAQELSSLAAVDGAQDFYPLRRSKAAELYDFKMDGFYSSSDRIRYAAYSTGPLQLDLHDGSVQNLIDGALVYIPANGVNSLFNQDTDPDLHGIEKGVFDITYKALCSSLTPISLRSDAELCSGADSFTVTTALKDFLEDLNEINLLIDHGKSAKLADGLFVVQ